MDQHRRNPGTTALGAPILFWALPVGTPPEEGTPGPLAGTGRVTIAGQAHGVLHSGGSWHKRKVWGPLTHQEDRFSQAPPKPHSSRVTWLGSGDDGETQ